MAVRTEELTDSVHTDGPPRNGSPGGNRRPQYPGRPLLATTGRDGDGMDGDAGRDGTPTY